MKLKNYWYFLFISLICHMFKYNFSSLKTYKLLHEVQSLYQDKKIRDQNHGSEWLHSLLLFISSETR